MNIINPASGALIKKIEPDTIENIRKKYEKAIHAKQGWKELTIELRIEKLRKFQQLLFERKEELAQTLSNEVGKPITQSRNEVTGAFHRMSYMLENGKKWLSEEILSDSGDTEELIHYEPLGVIANISAWNYPFLVGVNVFVPALMAGNCVLYKASEYSTLTGQNIRKLIYESGVPEDVFQVITGGAKAGDQLLNLPLDGYFFTGSYKTGKYIYEKVAKKMVPCQLELGGKDPLYISSDNSDIQRVAVNAAEGTFYNNGQSCCAVERIYVHDSIYESFLAAFVQEVTSYKVGDPMDETTFIGPLSRPAQLDVMKEQVTDALEKGANLLLGGHRIDRQGNYFEPTVFSNVNHSMKLMKEESFGPIIGIQKVSNDEEAVKLMMDTEYGLTAAVFADHQDSAMDILKQMDTGTVYWNCCDRVSGNLPWSGRKHSGIGSTLSYHGIRTFVKPKSYHLRSYNSK